MDILDILLDILLKPPQPFIGLFSFLEGSCAHKLARVRLTYTVLINKCWDGSRIPIVGGTHPGGATYDFAKFSRKLHEIETF